MINVTKTYLPNKKLYKDYIDKIYANGWVTNNGPMVKLLEKKLAEYLGVKNIVLVSNGTVALEIAYRTLGIEGDVITTPFSFVATTSSLVTNGLNPIFADIDAQTLNIDPNIIENMITKSTSAIVPVHVFSNACEIERIDAIAKQNNLKVIYDAAHSFNVKYKGASILNYGDISAISFHATKVFHSIEGGALIINNDELVEKARYLINFGIKNTEEIPELGTNAKMNEFEAAMGLCVLNDIQELNKKRKKIYYLYLQELEKYVTLQKMNSHSVQNHSYFPIILKNTKQLKRVEDSLKKENIYARRYFYPSLDTLKYINPKQYCKISRDISSKILCLPMYPELETINVKKICKIIKNNLC
jgi:dTDP-4-amino-4,6-dideoxygalactose transaminase